MHLQDKRPVVYSRLRPRNPTEFKIVAGFVDKCHKLRNTAPLVNPYLLGEVWECRNAVQLGAKPL